MAISPAAQARVDQTRAEADRRTTAMIDDIVDSMRDGLTDDEVWATACLSILSTLDKLPNTVAAITATLLVQAAREKNYGH